MTNKLIFRIKRKINFTIFVFNNFKFFFDKLMLIIKSKFVRKKIFYEYEDVPQYDQDTKNIVNKINFKTIEYYKKFSESKNDINQWLKNKNLIISKINEVLVNREKNDITVDSLLKYGIQNFEKKILNIIDTQEIIENFKNLKVYPAHVPIFSLKKKESISIIKKISPFGTYDQIDILKDKKLLSFITNKEILDHAIKFFGCIPTLANINLYWSFIFNKRTGPQNYHRDIDDYKVLNVFMNLTETSKNNGSYEHIQFSHDYDFIKSNLNNIDELKEDLSNFFNINYNGYGNDIFLKNKYFKDKIKEIYGVPGSINLADGFGLHRAVPPTINDRLVLWMTFGIKQTSHERTKNKYQKRIKFKDVKLKTFEKNLINKYVYRHLIDFSDEK